MLDPSKYKLMSVPSLLRCQCFPPAFVERNHEKREQLEARIRKPIDAWRAKKPRIRPECSGLVPHRLVGVTACEDTEKPEPHLVVTGEQAVVGRREGFVIEALQNV